MMKFTHDVSGNLIDRIPDTILAPRIISQPFNQVVTSSESASFSVVVADTNTLTFQWQFNSIDIPGATGDSLLLTNVSDTDEGQYSVVVTNSAGSVTSAPASLTLRRDPAVDIVTPPRLIVTSDGGGFVTVTPLKPSYNPGDSVSLTATPYLDNVFVGWAGIYMDKTPSRPLTIGKETTIVRAIFAPALPQLTALSDAGGSVTITPMKRSYNPGEIVTLTATPFAPSAFANWTGDLIGSDNPATLTMNGNKKVRARFSSGVAAPIPPGLIALWRGESDASDAIGGHDGAFFTGTAVDSQPVPAPAGITALGKVGQALNFDGTVHIRVPDSATLKPVLQMTIELWVFPTGGGTEQVIISRGGSDFGLNTWKIYLFNKYPNFASRERYGVSAPRPIPLNAWSHLAVTYDGLMGIKRLYVNGALVDKEIGSAATAIVGPLQYDPQPVPVTIGADWARTLGPDWEDNVINTPFYGRLDEVALYDRVLTTDEILSIYNAGSMGKDFSKPYFTSPTQLPDGVLTANYAQQVLAVAGISPLSFSLSAGVLPPGVTLSSAGLVNGVPGESGTFSFTVRATDAVGAFTEQLCGLQIFASTKAPAELVSWWRAENDAQDSAGTNHGMLRNGTGFALGRVGQAFALDGIDDFIEIPDAPTLQTVSVTLESWVAFDNVGPRSQTLFSKPHSSAPNTGFSYALWLSGTLINGRGASGSLSAPFSPIVGRWYHLAYTIDGGAKQQALYIDGIQVAIGDAPSPTVYGAQPLFLGCTKTSTPFDFLHGRIDEAAIYSRALSASEIASIYEAGAAGKHLPVS